LKTVRITICAKDVQTITGISYRAACRLIKKMKIHYQKSNHQFISISEFCTYTGLKKEEVTDHIR
jgi:hypothetical protein